MVRIIMVIHIICEEAEVLVFTTPTYCMHASAPIKPFLNLTFLLWMVHRPKACMFGEKAVILSTAAGNGTGSAIKDIKTALTFWGIPWIRTCGAVLQASDWDQVSEKKNKVFVWNDEENAEVGYGFFHQ